MPKTKKAKTSAAAGRAKKVVEKPVKKVVKAPVKKIAKKAVKKTAVKAVKRNQAAVKKPAAKKVAAVVANKKTSKAKTVNAKKIAKPFKIAKVSKKATKAVKPVKPVKTAKVTKPSAKATPKPVKAAKPVKLIMKPTKPVKAVPSQPIKTIAPVKPIKRKPAASGGPSGFAPYEQRRSEEYMSEEQLAHFQHILNLWKDQINADRNIVAKQLRDDAVNFPDPLDRAVVEEEHTLEWRAREREHRLIEKIDQALASIKQGDYGFCESCGAEIGIRRLEARPTATQCIDCKTIDEIREKQNGITE